VAKCSRSIAVPLNATALEVLQRQLGKHPVRVFTYAVKPLGSANTLAWRKTLKRAGIENFRWHDLRHLGHVASASGDANARAAAPGRLALFSYG